MRIRGPEWHTAADRNQKVVQNIYTSCMFPSHVHTESPDLLITLIVLHKVTARGCSRKQGEQSRGSPAGGAGVGGWCGGWGGHAWLAVAAVVSLTLLPSRHPCQLWWLQRVSLWAHLARRDTGSGIRAVTVSGGENCVIPELEGGSSIRVCVYGHTHAAADTSGLTLPPVFMRLILCPHDSRNNHLKVLKSRNWQTLSVSYTPDSVWLVLSWVTLWQPRLWKFILHIWLGLKP